MTEAEIQARIMLKLGSRPDTRLFRNNVGAAWQGDVVRTEAGGLVLLRNARRVEYGVCNPGGSDLLGWRRLLITPEMVGRDIAAFLAVEVKSATGRPTADQGRFLDAVRGNGGLAGAARSVEQALLIAGLT